MNNILNQLGEIKLPPVVVKVDEDTLKNIYITGVLIGATLIAMWALVNHFREN